MSIDGTLAATPIQTGETRIRQTPRRASASFAELLRAGGEILAASAEAALRSLPGGPILCAAVRGGADAAAARTPGRPEPASAARPESPGSAAPGSPQDSSQQDLWELTRESQSFNLMYLQLQEEMSRENRRYTTLSNVLKTRHETAQAIIANV
jgi:hypothetical protein